MTVTARAIFAAWAADEAGVLTPAPYGIAVDIDTYDLRAKVTLSLDTGDCIAVGEIATGYLPQGSDHPVIWMMSPLNSDDPPAGLETLLTNFAAALEGATRLNDVLTDVAADVILDLDALSSTIDTAVTDQLAAWAEDGTPLGP